MRIHLSILITTMLFAGCVEKSRDLTRTEREQIARFVSETPTSPDHEVHIDFEGKVELVGYDLSSETWTPGEEMTLTWHWKVDRALEDGWRLFTHVSDGRQPTVVNEDGAGLVRDLYQPGLWKAGEYIQDRQVITLPADWSASTAIVYVGLWNGPNRLRISDGPSDGDNRGRAATIRVSGAAANAEAAEAPETPTLIANALSEPLEIDGQLNEAAWQGAPSTRAFVNTMSGGRADFAVTAKTLFDDDNFYVGFVVRDDYLKASNTEHDDHLWEQDAVEIMVDPGGDGRNYFELQVSPRNVSFDTRYDTRRQPQPIGHADWDSELRSAVDLRGTLDDDEGDEGYTVEIAIPWEAFATGTPPAARPNPGESWRVNFYVMDAREEGQRAAGWSAPMVGDFHMPARFGTVQFGQAPQEPEPTPANPVLMQNARQRLQAIGRTNGLGRRTIPNETEQLQRNRPQNGEEVQNMPSMTESAME